MTGLLDMLLGQEPEPWPRDPTDDRWFTDDLIPTQAGVVITPESAMRIAAVHACVTVLAESVAQLPVALFRHHPDNSKERLDDHPLAPVIRFKPNRRMTRYEWLQVVVSHLALRGNHYSEIFEGPRGAIDQLVPLHPARVMPELLDSGRVRFKITDPRTGGQRTLVEEEVWHAKRMPLSKDFLTGLSPIGEAREAVGSAAAAASYAARFFANDARPGGTVSREGHFKDDAARNAFQKSLQQAFSRLNVHKIMVLEDGFKYEPVTMTNEDAQFIEARKFSDLDIAKIYRIPPPFLQIMDNANYSNTVQLFLAFVTHSLLPWLVLLEQRMKADFLVRDEDADIFIEFNVAGLLRGDLKTRYDAYFKGRQGGWISVNEIRALENLNPIEGGDEYLRPLNMAPIDEDEDGNPRRRRAGLLGPTGLPLTAADRAPVLRNGHDPHGL